MDDEECIHLNNPALCTICNGKEAASKRRAPAAPKPPAAAKRTAAKAVKATTAPASSTRVTRTVTPTESLDTEESVEEYRARFADDRQETLDAYVLVFFTSDARQFP